MSRRPLRLAFVGQHEFFSYTSLQAPAGGVEPTFIHFYPDAPVEPLLHTLEALDPDVVWVWRPELVPPGGLAALRALTVGYLSEPILRPGGVRHADLAERTAWMRGTDPSNYDRIVSFDPLIVPTVEQHMRVWRSFPIPVSDAYFAPVAAPAARPRVLFTGRATPHRDAFLGPVKKDFRTAHLAYGVTEDELIPFVRRSDVGLNLHNHPYPTFENRVPAYLAGGLLVITEPLSPRHGLQPGRDVLEVRTPWELYDLVREVERTPHAFHSVRVNGRRAAERWRASRVYPRFVADLIRDVRAFGRGRPAGALPATLGAA